MPTWVARESMRSRSPGFDPGETVTAALANPSAAPLSGPARGPVAQW